MTEFKKPVDRESFDENFGQIKPLMNATMAYYESSRCLFCYDAPCIKACPTGIDIPLFIRQINTENLVGAAKTIYASNYFGNACGKVCPTEVLCEGACVFNEQDVKPIEIGRLQNHATQHVIQNDTAIFNKKPSISKKVAVVGAGPAGISCASQLCELGYHVDVYESKGKAGGLALHGTAPYKIYNEEVDAEIDYLKRHLEFIIHLNKSINTSEEVGRLEQEYDAIFLGIGMGQTRTFNIQGEENNNCIGATELIEALKGNPFNTAIGKKVVVIGGGNTAMDAASECARMGAEEVTLVYRRSKDEMGAYEFELDLAKSVGVKAIFEAQPALISSEGITCIRTKNADGKLQKIDHSEFTILCDMIIKATGQAKQKGLLDKMGVAYDSKGRIITQPDSYQCSKPKYFAGGDALNGGAEVVNACAEAKQAALEIDAFIQNKK